LTRFKRACQKGDVFGAELAARELPHVNLENALRLVCLYAATGDEKFEHAAVRFLGRLIAERRDTMLGSVQLAAGALMELRGHRRELAVSVLRRLL
jgi:hypothetical protein